MKNIFNLGFKTVLHLKYYRIKGLVGCKMKSGTASVNTDSELRKQEAFFTHASQMCLAVNHNTSITSGK